MRTYTLYAALAVLAACAPTSSPMSDAGPTDGSISGDGAGPDGAASDGSGPDADSGSNSDGGYSGPGLTLIAGALGANGYRDAIGSDARFSSPGAAALDAAAKRLYVCEATDVRTVDLMTGQVATLAGISGVQGSTDGPKGVGTLYMLPYTGCALDVAGHTLWFYNNATSTSNGGLRAIDTATGTLSSLTTNTKVSPIGIAVDPATHSLYASDCSLFGGIVKIDTQTGQVTQPWGTRCASNQPMLDGAPGVATFQGTQALTFNAATNALYFLDGEYYGFLRAIDLGTGNVSTISGVSSGTLGEIDGPKGVGKFEGDGIAFDAATHTVFLTSWTIKPWSGDEYAIRAIDTSTGAVKTFAGNKSKQGIVDGVGTSARFWGPRALVTDQAGHVHVVDDAAVRTLDIATGAVTTGVGLLPHEGSTDGTGGAARFREPTNMVIDTPGNRAFVIDQGNLTIRAIDLASGTVTTVAGYPGAQGCTDGPSGSNDFQQPYGIAYEAATNRLYVTDVGCHAIRAVDVASGQVSTLVGAPASPGIVDGPKIAARLDGPRGLALDEAHSALYFTEFSGATSVMRVVDTKKAVVTTLDSTATDPFFYGDTLSFSGKSGLLYFCLSSLRIATFNPASNLVTSLAGTDSQRGDADGALGIGRFNDLRGLVYDPTRDAVFVRDVARVRKVDAKTGIITTITGQVGMLGVLLGPVSTAGLNVHGVLPYPQCFGSSGGLTVDTKGDVVMADCAENAVLRLNGF